MTQRHRKPDQIHGVEAPRECFRPAHLFDQFRQAVGLSNSSTSTDDEVGALEVQHDFISANFKAQEDAGANFSKRVHLVTT